MPICQDIRCCKVVLQYAAAPAERNQHAVEGSLSLLAVCRIPASLRSRLYEVPITHGIRFDFLDAWAAAVIYASPPFQSLLVMWDGSAAMCDNGSSIKTAPGSWHFFAY